MKKYGTVIAFGFAVLFGTVAVWLSHQWLTANSSEARQVFIKEEAPSTEIVVATRDLSMGEQLTRDNLTLVRWPEANILTGAFEELSAVEGRVTLSKMVAGEPVLEAKLAAPGSGVGLVALIPEGKRAMSIRVDEVIGVGGFILPDTFVDVIAVGNPVNSKKKEAKTILEKVKVLAIAQETFTEEGKAKVVRTVTMELKSKEAEKLALQTSQAAIHLVLRNPMEEVKEPPKRKKVVRRKAKAKAKPKPKPRAPEPPSFEVEVVKGEKPPVKYEFKSAVVE